MKLVVDSNVLFTFFWKRGTTRNLFVKQELELISAEFSLEEIKKYEKEIIKKAKLSRKEFNDLRKELATIVEFISLDEYKDFLQEAVKITSDQNDVDFFALALKMSSSIWSNEKNLKKQNKVFIFSTEEVIDLID